ncbi:hypothetical protein [Roseateles sp. P5_E1]
MMTGMRVLRWIFGIGGALILLIAVSLGLFFFGKQVELATGDHSAEVNRLESELQVAEGQVSRCRIDVARDQDEAVSLYDAIVQRGGDGSETHRSLLARHVAIQADCTRKSDRLTELIRELGIAKLKRARAAGMA